MKSRLAAMRGRRDEVPRGWKEEVLRGWKEEVLWGGRKSHLAAKRSWVTAARWYTPWVGGKKIAR